MFPLLIKVQISFDKKEPPLCVLASLLVLVREISGGVVSYKWVNLLRSCGGELVNTNIFSSPFFIGWSRAHLEYYKALRFYPLNSKARKVILVSDIWFFAHLQWTLFLKSYRRWKIENVLRLSKKVSGLFLYDHCPPWNCFRNLEKMF